MLLKQTNGIQQCGARWQRKRSFLWLNLGNPTLTKPGIVSFVAWDNHVVLKTFERMERHARTTRGGALGDTVKQQENSLHGYTCRSRGLISSVSCCGQVWIQQSARCVGFYFRSRTPHWLWNRHNDCCTRCISSCSRTWAFAPLLSGNLGQSSRTRSCSPVQTRRCRMPLHYLWFHMNKQTVWMEALKEVDELHTDALLFYVAPSRYDYAKHETTHKQNCG